MTISPQASPRQRNHWPRNCDPAQLDVTDSGHSLAVLSPSSRADFASEIEAEAVSGPTFMSKRIWRA